MLAPKCGEERIAGRHAAARGRCARHRLLLLLAFPRLDAACSMDGQQWRQYRAAHGTFAA
jgi:hypothetical protein